MMQGYHARPVIDAMPGSPASFKLGMRRLASGVSLVTTSFRGKPAGFVATSVSAVTAEPPTLLVCTNREASAHDPIDQAGTFCINFLSRDDEEIAAQFSSSERRKERFGSGSWETTRNGMLALSSALAWLDCEIETRVRHHTPHDFHRPRSRGSSWGRRSTPHLFRSQLHP